MQMQCHQFTTKKKFRILLACILQTQGKILNLYICRGTILSLENCTRGTIEPHIYTIYLLLIENRHRPSFYITK